MDISSFLALLVTDGVTPLSLPPALLLDTGRQITVYDPTQIGSPHVALFRQVMMVSGSHYSPSSGSEWEGISNTIVYICVWSTDNFGSLAPELAPAFLGRTG